MGEIEQGTDAVGCPLAAKPLVLIHQLADVLDRVYTELRVNINAIAMIMRPVKTKTEAAAELIEKGAVRAEIQMTACQLLDLAAPLRRAVAKRSYFNMFSRIFQFLYGYKRR